MPNYRRKHEGNLYCFTLVTRGRRPLFADESARRLLRHAMDQTRRDHPWETVGMVLLPDHLHFLWELPKGDSAYSQRIATIKKRFTRAYLAAGGTEASIPTGQRRLRLRGVWQQRFWEHTIRDHRDLHMHLDYIHMNPVKHGLANRPADWPWSSFHRYIKEQWYEEDWSGRVELPGSVDYLCTE